jgi:ribosome maturation factor RimP
VKQLERLEQRIAPTLQTLGYEVVRVAVGGGGRKTLQIMADRIDRKPISVDDCAAISEVLSAVFDVEEPLPGAYDLEVSSPGIDRPLTRAKDFAAYAGHEAKVETTEMIDGRRRFKGVLRGLGSEGEVRLEVDGIEIGIAPATIASAKLVMTDKLLEASRQRDETEASSA